MSEAKIYAIFQTSRGRIVCQLFPQYAPKTVANFIGLAQGETEWTHPRTRLKRREPFYDGLIFHRVIADFMIQGGCPLGTGFGGPGYQFEDEFHQDLRFDRPGRLAMANSGPNTNGSQFFITQVATPWLDNRHTIFGQVVEGQDVVNAIASAETTAQDRPLDPVVIEKVTIERVFTDDSCDRE